MSANRLSTTAALLFVACIDALLVALRCPSSPAIDAAPLAVTLVAQACAVLLVHWGTLEPARSFREALRRPVLQWGLFLLVASVPIARYTIDLGDAVGRPNWYRSVGLGCSQSFSVVEGGKLALTTETRFGTANYFYLMKGHPFGAGVNLVALLLVVLAIRASRGVPVERANAAA